MPGKRVLLVGYEDRDNLGLRYLKSSATRAGHSATIMTYQSDPAPLLAAVRREDPDVILVDQAGGLEAMRAEPRPAVAEFGRRGRRQPVEPEILLEHQLIAPEGRADRTVGEAEERGVGSSEIFALGTQESGGDAGQPLEEADYFQIIDHERDILGPDLISRQEVVVRPGQSQVVVLQGQGQEAAVGVVVGYRDIERAKWRVISPLSTRCSRIVRGLPITHGPVSVSTPTRP